MKAFFQEQRAQLEEYKSLEHASVPPHEDDGALDPFDAEAH